MPPELIEQLQRACALEDAADTLDRRHHARRATAILLLAAFDAGWRNTELAAVVGCTRNTISRRVNAERRRRGGEPAGLGIPGPRHPHHDIRGPVAQRDWLTTGEAAEYLGLAVSTVHGLVRDGLLPNTRKLTPGRRAHARADLDRIRSAPRRGARQVDRRDVLTQSKPSV